MAKSTTSRAAKRAAAKAARDGRPKPDTTKTAAGVNAAGTKGADSEAERQAQNSADAANEISRRRHEPGAPDPDNDGPDVGRVDNRADTTFETQQIPRPARPLTPVNATEQALAKPLQPGEKDDGSLASLARFAKVKALKIGYFDNIRRRAGDVFWIHKADDFSEAWMEYAGSSDPEKITTGNQELRKQHDDVMKAKADESAGTGSADVFSPR